MKKNCQPKNTLQGRSAETGSVPADGHAALPDITVWVKGGKGGKTELSLLFIARILASPQPLGDGFLPAGRP